MSFNNSTSTDTDLSPNDPLFWRRPTPLDCTTVRVVGIFLCLTSLVGIFLNGSLLISFARHRALCTPPNIFIIFIASIGFFASCTNVPLSGSSSVFCYWLYNHVGCQIEGLVAFLYGGSSCYLLCTVSLSRCYIIVKPFNAQNVTVRIFIFLKRKEKIMNILGSQICSCLMCRCIDCTSMDYLTTCWME